MENNVQIQVHSPVCMVKNLIYHEKITNNVTMNSSLLQKAEVRICKEHKLHCISAVPGMHKLGYATF